ncbi:hypothetical protein AUEXF2481DRAFT_33607 [Aureobasidium subglaciale EXF-2481]|uniref:Zn(2)-C6 fungal-type domain-containing protein n=1 Tax=Aureobasidium subglaciale (strain EXF-2481) TaxID=1043005 RepID=A0A074Y4C3_AURSE|nr:uncharacterized protein AUEXF2481DRAFT_33607 [Aureobasidium subglaciale EXF-2481]KAI5198079.1 hypothetical protein E4T38_07701 [Aureobasidium subglaciale]KAI5216921.1 hypothetical protein E4T40_07711 [Aureobasidium subglaciale]KAI5220180.1 hypothetical protein E4T41_07626 [Aureobasidium subglaciale]KAI5258192.1 hypothetical protein E4T46_07602 [Aureobasidium subglaciale]KEQ90809.1 hypothetical protein AUEXF2481DRAFT_33607 [Aureobasidium subglaciale EXF-2481]
MSEERPAKRIRKGTRSCQECRHRKVRCIWLSDNAQVCQSCATKNRTCELQIEVVQSSEPKLSSRARIEALEKQVNDLWAAISSGAGVGATSSPSQPRYHPQADDTRSINSQDRESSPDTSEPSSPANPPSHLLRLFDNDLLDSNGHDITTPSTRLTNSSTYKETSSLLALLPSREDMVIIAANSASWLSWYKVLFSLNLAMGTGDMMLSTYDRIKQSETHPVPIATLLLAIAITVQQAPTGNAMKMLQSIPDARAFIKTVSTAVERSVMSNDDLIADLEGIRGALLFVRLQLGRARVRKTWLTLRRVIAVAELIGLPRAAATVQLHAEPQSRPVQVPSDSYREHAQADQKEKAEVWESICAIDRIMSLMWSLPIATASFPLPMRPIIDMQGEVIPQAFIHRLANIASRVLELDGVYTQSKSVPELLNMVMSTDQELQVLAQSPAKSWWQDHRSQMTPSGLFQYWHTYITIRTHLRLALAYDHDQRFFYNFMSCLSACQEHARRYTSLRPLLPKGFFANLIVDLQAFSAIIFLLLAANKPATTSSSAFSWRIMDTQQTRVLIDEAVQVMEQASKRTESQFAAHGVEAIRSLRLLLQRPNSAEPQKVSLLLPLIGRIHVSRKSSGSGQQSNRTMQPAAGQELEFAPRDPPGGYAADTANIEGSNYLDPDIINSLSYSMEVPEDYLFFTDQSFGAEQWLTWST